jgi:hypothetical protein
MAHREATMLPCLASDRASQHNATRQLERFLPKKRYKRADLKNEEHGIEMDVPSERFKMVAPLAVSNPNPQEMPWQRLSKLATASFLIIRNIVLSD